MKISPSGLPTIATVEDVIAWADSGYSRGGIPMPAHAEMPRCVKQIDMHTYPMKDWPAMIAARDEAKAWPLDLREIGGPNGGRIPSRDQDGIGFCWGHSVIAAMLMLLARAGQPYADLSAFSVCCPIKDYRDEGGWSPEALDFVTAKGCATSEFWPQKSMSRRHDNEATWRNAAKYKIVEAWADMSQRIYDRDMSALQVGTALLDCTPVNADYYHMSHSVCLGRLVDVHKSKDPEDPTRYGVDYLNSWTDNWGKFGVGRIEGRLWVPDLATAPRVISAH